MSVRVAYLMNQYPAVSHTFIRREIHALEQRGVKVQRIALRGWDARVVDDVDRQEQLRTRYVLVRGAKGLAAAMCRAAMRSPTCAFRALGLALRMARQSDRSLLAHLAYFAEACVIHRWTAEAQVEHLHAHFATNPAEVAMLVRALGGPTYSFTAHGSDIMDRPAQMGLPLTVGHAAFVVAVCSFGRNQIFKCVPQVLWERVHVVHCGLTRGYGTNIPSTPVGQRLLCIGRLSKEKGQLLLVQAAKLLADWGEQVDIVLAGDGPMRPEVEALISASKLTEKIRITGWLNGAGIEHELGEARALIVPSLSEGLPVVIMEAMAASRPVVAPYLAGIPELVVNGRNGWLFPPSDVAALAVAMRAAMVVSDPEWRQMGESARADVWAAHDVDAEAGKLAGLFQRTQPATYPSKAVCPPHP